MVKVADYKPCAGCGKMGYTDERAFSKEMDGHMCVRCTRQDLDWSNAKTWKVEEKKES